MTRDEADLVAGLVRAEFPVWMVNGRSVVISVGNDFTDREPEQADGWYVRIDTGPPVTKQNAPQREEPGERHREP